MLRSCSFTVLHLANNSGTVPPRSATLDKLSRALPAPARGKLGKIDLNILNVTAYLDRGANPNPLPVILVLWKCSLVDFFVIFSLLFVPTKINKMLIPKEQILCIDLLVNKTKRRPLCIIIGGGIGNEKQPIKK